MFSFVQTRKLVNLGLLISLSVVLTRFFGTQLLIAGVGALRLSFGEVPIMLAGVLFGPLAGACVGGLADIIGFAINPMGGAYIPLLTVTAALTGALPGWLLSGRDPTTVNPWLVGGAVAVTGLVVAAGLNTYVLSLALGRPAMALFPLRLLARILLTPAHAGAVMLLCRTYRTVAIHSRA